MRRTWMAWLAAMAGLIPASAIAQTPPGWSIGPEAYYYSYREPALDFQWGYFGGIDAGYNYKT